MTEVKNKMPRGQWMATEGRQLYHSWLADTLDLHRQKTDAFKNRGFGVGSEQITSNAMWLADCLADELIEFERSKPVEERLLFQSRDDIVHYTSVDEFIGDNNTAHGIVAHIRDGVSFATKVSVGFALEACKKIASTHPVKDEFKYYDLLTEVMQSPSFHTVLEEFATTGFAVLRNTTKNAAHNIERAFDEFTHEISSIVGLDQSASSVIHVKFNEGGPVFYLDPTIKKALSDQMKTQNKTRELIHRGGRSYTILKRLDEGSFTSGCPVRRAPAGGEKSAIALLSGYMGEKVQDVIVKKLREKQIGAQGVARAYAQA